MNKNVIEKILEIINSSERTAPAHFTSNGDRTQSFCVDFEINKDDEYEMAATAWGKAKNPAVIRTGENLMLASYLAVKLKGENSIPQLQEIIIDEDQKDLPNLSDDMEYLKQCIEFGQKLAHKT